MGRWWHLGGQFKEADSAGEALFQYVIFGFYLLGVYFAYKVLTGHVLVPERGLRSLEMRATEEGLTE